MGLVQISAGFDKNKNLNRFIEKIDILGEESDLIIAPEYLMGLQKGDLSKNLVRERSEPIDGGFVKVLREKAEELEVENPTVALLAKPSCSHAHSGDAPSAMNDGILPESSIDHEIPRFTWWAHRGTEEWVQYEWDKPVKLSHAEVYWFDDTGRGQCRVPASWKLLYRQNGEWKPVDAEQYPVKEDQFCKVDFEPVRTTAVRLRVKLQDNFSGGILEWRVAN